MFLGKGSDKQSDADEVNTVRRGSVMHSPTVSTRRTSMPLLTPIVTETQLSTTAPPSATSASASSAATHETKHTTTNSRLQSSTSANLPALRDEATLSLIFQVIMPNLQATNFQLRNVSTADLLTSTNFHGWKRKATDILLSLGLLSLVTTEDHAVVVLSELTDSDLNTAFQQLGLKPLTKFQFKLRLTERLSFAYTVLKRLCGRSILNSLQRIKAGDARALWNFILHTNTTRISC